MYVFTVETFRKTCSGADKLEELVSDQCLNPEIGDFFPKKHACMSRGKGGETAMPVRHKRKYNQQVDILPQTYSVCSRFVNTE